METGRSRQGPNGTLRPEMRQSGDAEEHAIYDVITLAILLHL